MAFTRKSDGDNLFAAEINEFQIGIENSEGHITRVDNPHSVTKEQVGLANVDNTSDIDKPISTATQLALDNKTNLNKLAYIPVTITEGGTTAAKTATIPGYTPSEGDILRLTFTNGTAVNSPTLNINGTGAVPIRLGTAAATSVSFSVGAGGSILVYYDGTDWQQFGSTRTSDLSGSTYSSMSLTEAQTGTATTSRVITAATLKDAIVYHSPPTDISGKSDIGHTHDDRYYTETEADNRFAWLSTHEAHSTRTDNPHGVTAAQVGAAPVSHTHTIAQVTSLQAALDDKAASSHTHDDRYYTEAETNSLLNGKANSSHTHSIRVPVVGYGEIGSQQVNIADGASYTHLNTTIYSSSDAQAMLITVAMSVYGDLGYAGTFYIRCWVDGVMYESGLFQADQGVDAGAVYTFAANLSDNKTSRNFQIQTRCATGIYTARNTSWSYLFAPRSTSTL